MNRIANLLHAPADDLRLFGRLDMHNSGVDSEEDEISRSVASAFETWWMTERREDEASEQRLALVRQHLNEASKAIFDLVSEIDVKTAALKRLEEQLAVLRKETEETRILTTIPKEAVDAITKQIKQSIRSEQERGKARRFFLASVNNFFWAVAGAFCGYIISTILR